MASNNCHKERDRLGEECHRNNWWATSREPTTQPLSHYKAHLIISVGSSTRNYLSLTPWVAALIDRYTTELCAKSSTQHNLKLVCEFFSTKHKIPQTSRELLIHFHAALSPVKTELNPEKMNALGMSVNKQFIIIPKQIRLLLMIIHERMSIPQLTTNHKYLFNK